MVASEYWHLGPTKPATQPVQTLSQKLTQRVPERSVTALQERAPWSSEAGVDARPACQSASDANPVSGPVGQATAPDSQRGVQAVGAVASQPRQVSGQASGAQTSKQIDCEAAGALQARSEAATSRGKSRDS